MNTREVKTLQGATSLYVVVFTALLVSVITMSFIRIMVSEAEQTSRNELSQSAYDSALAGVEDAKIALASYYDCIQRPSANNCTTITAAMQSGITDSSCDVVSNVLGRNLVNGTNQAGEVYIQETQVSGSGATNMEQAYTCVKIDNRLDDYRSTLSPDDRSRIIPIRADNVNAIKAIKFSWYSGTSTNVMTNGKFERSGTAYIPALTLDIYQTNDTFTLGQLSANNGNYGTDHSKLMLYPTNTHGTTNITASMVLNSSDKYDNSPINVNCGNSNTEFRCQSMVGIPAPFNGGARSAETFFLKVTAPYGQAATDFAVILCTNDDWATAGCTSTTEFVDVQASVDSTGRANNLYRRVESRIDLADVNFPYPEFAIQLGGTDDDSISKKFWVTKDCYKSGYNSNGEFYVSACPNTGDAPAGL